MTLFVSDDPVGSCLVSTVFRHVRSTQREHISNHKVVAERVVELQITRSCRAQHPKSCVLFENFDE